MMHICGEGACEIWLPTTWMVETNNGSQGRDSPCFPPLIVEGLARTSSDRATNLCTNFESSSGDKVYTCKGLREVHTDYTVGLLWSNRATNLGTKVVVGI